MDKHSHNRNIGKIILVLIVAMFVAAGITTVIQEPQTVQAATKNGWVQDGSTWYYYKNGSMVKGEFISLDSGTYYLRKDGKMAKGWKTIKGNRYYFNKPNGDMVTGFLTIGDKRYYFRKADGVLFTNKMFRVGKWRYYAQEDGSLFTGFKEVNSRKYYFTKKGAKRNGWYKIGKLWYYMENAGYCRTGWFDWTNGSGVSHRYYCRKEGKYKGAMMHGSNQKIGSTYYNFSSDGAYISTVTTITSGNGISKYLATPTSAKTIRNFLLNAMKPVGNTLYIWGGGHGSDATIKGVGSKWYSWYNSQSGSYNYANYRFKYGYGLDCSGFVGWSVYQMMGTYSTTVSGTTGTYYSEKGYGSTKLSGKINNSYKAGDIMYNGNHVWIVVGQCSDKSLVLVHATPPCVQIAGTPTPSGSYSSNAIKLAKTYMSRYYSGTVSKFSLGSQVSLSYLQAYSMFRWNSKTLSDPDEFKSKSAKSILKSIFGES